MNLLVNKKKDRDSDKLRIVLLDTKHSNPNHYILICIEEALKKHPLVEFVEVVNGLDALNVVIRNKCNLFFAFDGEELDRGLCQRLSFACDKSILWVTEDPFENDINIKNSSIFDYVFTNDSKSAKNYPSESLHLPFAAYPKFHYFEIPNKEKDHYFFDLLFVGTAWPNRVKFLKNLIPKLKELRIKIALPYNEFLPPPDIGLAKSSILWKVANPELARLVNRSRIVLTLHRDFSGSGNGSISETPGPRLFEAALAGGFQLADLSLNEISKYFNLEKEISGFHSTEDCLSKIKYFISHPEERIEIAKNAQKRCFTEHLYEHRIEKLINKIKSPSYKTKMIGINKRFQEKNIKRILFVSHNLVNVIPFGGVEVYVDQLTKSLPENYESLIYFRDQKYSSNKVMGLNYIKKNKRLKYVFNSDLDPFALTDLEREIQFGKILREEKIDLVHINHLIGHPWSLPLVARTMGIPVVMTIHDYFPICSHFNLINEVKEYCNIPNLPLTTCDLCLNQQDGVYFGSQSSRRSFISFVLNKLDLIIFPSHSCREVVQEIYPSLKKNSRIWVEGIPTKELNSSQYLNIKTDSLKVVVFGNFNHLKGGDSLCKIFNAMRNDPIEFHIYGLIQSPYNEILKKLNIPNLIIHGPYSPDTIDFSILQADISLILSIWPETYVLTLSESWKAHLVPIVTDIGALGERVTNRLNGLKVGVNNPGEVVQILRELISDPSELERIRSNIHNGFYRTLDEHLKLLLEQYDKLLDEYKILGKNETFCFDDLSPENFPCSVAFRNRKTWNVLNPCPELNTIPLRLPLKEKIKKVKAYFHDHGFKATFFHSIYKIKQKIKNRGFI